MPPRKAANSEPDEEDLFASLPDELGDFEQLRSVLARLGTDPVTIKVSRMDESGGTEYCFTSQDGNLDEGYIQGIWGGGVYICRVLIDNVYRRTVRLKIAQPTKKSGAEPTTAPAAAPSSGEGFMLPFIIKMMQTQAEAQTRIFEAILLNNGGGNGRSETPVSELVGGLRDLQAMTGGEKKDPTEVFLKGVEFATALKAKAEGGAVDWKTQLVQTLGEIGPQLAAAVAPRPGGGQPVAVPMQPQPNPQPMTAEEQERRLIESARAGLGELKKKALAGVDPGLIVDWVLANAQDYQLLIWIAVNWNMAKLAEVEPDAGTEPFKSWLAEARDGIRSAYTPNDQMGLDTAGESGDMGDAKSDGDSSPEGDAGDDADNLPPAG